VRVCDKFSLSEGSERFREIPPVAAESRRHVIAETPCNRYAGVPHASIVSQRCVVVTILHIRPVRVVVPLVAVALLAKQSEERSS